MSNVRSSLYSNNPPTRSTASGGINTYHPRSGSTTTTHLTGTSGTRQPTGAASSIGGTSSVVTMSVAPAVSSARPRFGFGVGGGSGVHLTPASANGPRTTSSSNVTPLPVGGAATSAAGGNSLSDPAVAAAGGAAIYSNAYHQNYYSEHKFTAHHHQPTSTAAAARPLATTGAVGTSSTSHEFSPRPTRTAVAATATATTPTPAAAASHQHQQRGISPSLLASTRASMNRREATQRQLLASDAMRRRARMVDAGMVPADEDPAYSNNRMAEWQNGVSGGGVGVVPLRTTSPICGTSEGLVGAPSLSPSDALVTAAAVNYSAPRSQQQQRHHSPGGHSQISNATTTNNNPTAIRSTSARRIPVTASRHHHAWNSDVKAPKDLLSGVGGGTNSRAGTPNRAAGGGGSRSGTPTRSIAAASGGGVRSRRFDAASFAASPSEASAAAAAASPQEAAATIETLANALAQLTKERDSLKTISLQCRQVIETQAWKIGQLEDEKRSIEEEQYGRVQALQEELLAAKQNSHAAAAGASGRSPSTAGNNTNNDPTSGGGGGDALGASLAIMESSINLVRKRSMTYGGGGSSPKHADGGGASPSPDRRASLAAMANDSLSNSINSSSHNLLLGYRAASQRRLKEMEALGIGGNGANDGSGDAGGGSPLVMAATGNGEPAVVVDDNNPLVLLSTPQQSPSKKGVAREPLSPDDEAAANAAAVKMALLKEEVRKLKKALEEEKTLRKGEEERNKANMAFMEEELSESKRRESFVSNINTSGRDAAHHGTTAANSISDETTHPSNQQQRRQSELIPSALTANGATDTFEAEIAFMTTEANALLEWAREQHETQTRAQKAEEERRAAAVNAAATSGGGADGSIPPPATLTLPTAYHPSTASTSRQTLSASYYSNTFKDAHAEAYTNLELFRGTHQQLAETLFQVMATTARERQRRFDVEAALRRGIIALENSTKSEANLTEDIELLRSKYEKTIELLTAAEDERVKAEQRLTELQNAHESQLSEGASAAAEAAAEAARAALEVSKRQQQEEVDAEKERFIAATRLEKDVLFAQFQEDLDRQRVQLNEAHEEEMRVTKAQWELGDVQLREEIMRLEKALAEAGEQMKKSERDAETTKKQPTTNATSRSASAAAGGGATPDDEWALSYDDDGVASSEQQQKKTSAAGDDSANTIVIATLQQELTEAKAALSAAEEALATAKAEQSTAETNAADLTAQLESLKATIASMTAEAEANSSTAKKEAEEASARAAEEAETALANAEAEIASLKTTIADKDAALAAAAASSENNSTAATTAAVDAAVAEKEQSLKQTHADEVLSLTTAHNTEIAALQTDHTATVEGLEGLVEELKQQLIETQSALMKLEDEVAQRSTSAAASNEAELKEANETIMLLHGTVDALKAEKEALEMQLATEQQNAADSISKMEQEIERSVSKAKVTTASATAFEQKARAEAHEAREALAAAEAELNSLKKEHSESSAAASTAAEKAALVAAAKDAEIATLKQELEVLLASRQQRQEGEEEAAKQKLQQAVEEEKASAAAASAAALATQQQAHEAKEASLNERIAALINELEESKAATATAKTNAAAAESSLQQRVESLSTEVAKLQQQLSAAEESAANASTSATTNATTAATTIAEHESTIASLKQELFDLQQSILEQQSAEHEAHEAALKQLQEEFSTRKTEAEFDSELEIRLIEHKRLSEASQQAALEAEEQSWMAKMKAQSDRLEAEYAARTHTLMEDHEGTVRKLEEMIASLQAAAKEAAEAPASVVVVAPIGATSKSSNNTVNESPSKNPLANTFGVFVTEQDVTSVGSNETEVRADARIAELTEVLATVEGERDQMASRIVEMTTQLETTKEELSLTQKALEEQVAATNDLQERLMNTTTANNNISIGSATAVAGAGMMSSPSSMSRQLSVRDVPSLPPPTTIEEAVDRHPQLVEMVSQLQTKCSKMQRQLNDILREKEALEYTLKQVEAERNELIQELEAAAHEVESHIETPQEDAASTYGQHQYGNNPYLPPGNGGGGAGYLEEEY